MIIDTEVLFPDLKKFEGVYATRRRTVSWHPRLQFKERVILSEILSYILAREINQFLWVVQEKPDEVAIAIMKTLQLNTPGGTKARL